MGWFELSVEVPRGKVITEDPDGCGETEHDRCVVAGIFFIGMN